MISLPKFSKVLTPQLIENIDSSSCLAITTEGRMLVFPVKNLPILSKGKGNKIINIPSARAKAREEFVTLLAIVPDGASVTLHAGRRKLTLKASDIEHYRGERGRRGNKLPRGLQRVDLVEVESIKSSVVEQDLSDKE